MILEVENNSYLLLAVLGKILKWIHMGVPIALIILVSIDLGKAVISQDDEMVSKAVQNIKRRVIAGLTIFFVPTIVEILMSRVFIGLNMDSREYDRIITSYKNFIHSENIDVDFGTKSSDINGKLVYSMDSKEDKAALQNEINFPYYSKTITSYIFNNKSFKTIIYPYLGENFTINYNNKSYTIDNFVDIKYKNIETGETVDNGDYIISSVFLRSVTLEKERLDKVILNYYYKKNNDEYKIDKVGVVVEKSVNDYLKSVKTSEKNNDSEVIATSKFISVNKDYDYSKLNALPKDEYNSVFEKNKSKILSLNTYKNGTISTHATGFLIHDGIVATSLSYLKSSLLDSKTIVCLDNNNNKYQITGVVSIDEVLDIAVLKLNKAVKGSVTFASKESLSKDDPVISVTSKTGFSFSLNLGIVSSNSTNLISVLPISKNDWGSPVFNTSGNVVGITTAKIVNSELSSASSIVGLQKLQSEIKGSTFSRIKTESLDNLKNQFFNNNLNKEKIINTIPKKVWNEYKNVGDVESSIVLDLVKANYYSGIVSLRYYNATYRYINNIEYATDFISAIENSGYKLVSKSNEKIMYKKGNDKVVIISEFDYLIIVLAKGSVI